jgi:prefoldin alpha subunit
MIVRPKMFPGRALSCRKFFKPDPVRAKNIFRIFRIAAIYFLEGDTTTDAADLTMMYLCSGMTYISGERLLNSLYRGVKNMADTMQQMDQRELMTLQHYMKEYGQQAEIFVGQLEMLENGRMEAHAAIETLEAMLSAEDGVVLLQIGGGASVRAKVLEPDKILLSIGAEVVVERSNKDAIEFLKERIMEMEASQKKVAETLDRLRSQMNEINKRLETGYQQAAATGQDQE